MQQRVTLCYLYYTSISRVWLSLSEYVLGISLATILLL